MGSSATLQSSCTSCLHQQAVTGPVRILPSFRQGSSAGAQACSVPLLPANTGCKAVGFICDVTRPEDVERLAAQATEALGQIDVFVANAAQSARAKTPLFETSTTELQASLGGWGADGNSAGA